MIRTGKTKNKPLMASINLTPLTDVLLTLLVLFLVLESYGGVTAMEIGLPALDKVKTPKNPTISVNADASGKIFISTADTGRMEIPASAYKRRLAIMRKQMGYNAVIIKAHRGLKYHRIVSLMDAARTAGFENVSLDTGNR